MDKLLITYFYKERVEHNDLLNRTTLKLLKYAIFPLCFIGGLAIASNYNSVVNVYPPKHYANEHTLIFNLWAAP